MIVTIGKTPSQVTALLGVLPGARVAVAERSGGDERGRKVRRSARKSREWSFVTLFVTLWRRSTPRIVGKEVR
jgi:hypothetical protein